MKSTCLTPVLFALLAAGCIKQQGEDPDETTCNNIRQVTLTSNSPVTIGGTIHFSAPEVGGYRIYNWRGPRFFTSQEPDNVLTDAKTEQEGWYYLELSNPSCGSKIDSVYIDIKLQQGTPSCTIPNNTCQFSNQGTDTYSTVRKRIDPSYHHLSLYSYGTNADIAVLFHDHWLTKEPEDGIYKTVNSSAFDQIDYNYNKVFVTTTKNSIFWSSGVSQNVYVSHVNGKLQVRFCSLVMGGYNGASFTTQASATLTEQ